MKPCIQCGEVSDQSRCPEHRKDTRDKRERGYDWRWDELSRRARRLQNFCGICGSTDDLQADHLPSAWERKAQGKVIRLADIQVVCGTCNRDLGSSRPGSPRATQAGGGQPTASRPVGKAQEALHTPGGIG
ncbi:hypothetical protein [Mycolicibacterium sp. OfavD-34-C]|uniref:hypothetical protein n=1 Tax=Mycolicibacterium sp. OfavD-34-C TaxID=2917746 RepID=UPI001EF41205|nr:hypothetical protein [Mycolicibacterium sp. OfavD-34-C]MCG7582781.1 hypothetical protein [Mycolicibacterium sp. OfavD-34-C]